MILGITVCSKKEPQKHVNVKTELYPKLRRLRQDDTEFKASLGYTAISCLKITKENLGVGVYASDKVLI
jgi:hypothetical protein